MPFPGGGTGSAQDLEAGEAAWVDQELIGASGSSFGDLPPAAGPSTSFDGGGINGGSTSHNVGATVVDPPAPEVKPVKRKKRGWKGWAVVTQDEHGNLIEVNDELPDGVRVKPIRAPASATIRVGAQSGGAPASGSLQSDQPETSSPVAAMNDTGATDRASGLNGTSRQPRRAAAMAHVALAPTPPSRRGSPKPRSTTPASSIPNKKRKRASGIPPITVPKKSLHRPANRGVSLSSSEAPLSPAVRRGLSPDLRKSLAASALDHAQAPLKGKGKGKGKEREVGPESPEPANSSSSRRPSTASTSLVDLHDFQPEIEESEFSREQPTSPLRLGMGVYQPPPKLSALRTQTQPSPRPVSPAPERWRALPPEANEPDLLLYVPAVLPEELERPVPHPSYSNAKRGPREDISTFELQHENGLSGITLAMERDAVGFLDNVKANLQTLLQFTCPQPTVARTAFVERLGRGLQELGWTMTDEGDI